MANRAAAQKRLLDRIESLTPKSKKNRELYESRLKGMSDAEFGRFIERLSNGQESLMIVSPNEEDDGLSIENNFKVADSIGHSFFTKILVVGMEGMPDHVTPVEHMVIDLPIRRVSQTSDKKISVPKSSKVIDSLSGQVTGESKGSAISGPEVQVLAAMGLENTLIEALKYRGGDRQGRAALNGIISKHGHVNLKTLERYQSGVESTNTLRTYLTAMHLKNNL